MENAKCPWCGAELTIWACCPQNTQKATWERGEYTDRRAQELEQETIKEQSK